jgi:hypothetical protein
MKTAEEISNFSNQQRNEIANQLFDIQRVSENIEAHAELGFRVLRLEQETPLDLSNTPAAIELISSIQKVGYETAWRRAIWPCEPTRPNTAVEYVELEISWGI